MNYEKFINQKVTNYKGQKGHIVSINQERVTVQLEDGQAIYKPDIAFKNKALVFDDDNLNQIMNGGLNEQDALEEEHKKNTRRTLLLTSFYLKLDRKRYFYGNN